MAGEWRRASIGALCDAGVAELQTGPFGSQLHAYDYVDDGVPVVPTEAIRGRRIDHSVLPKITQAKAQELERHRLRVGDILFARRGVQATGHVGCVRDAEDGFICGTGAIRLRITRASVEIDAAYLSHVLADPISVEWFKFHAIGATMPNLNEGIIRSFPLFVPPLPEQRAIAHILGTLDDKIELNRRMSETLEAMARALFKSWFIDFDPVRRNAARARNQASAPAPLPSGEGGSVGHDRGRDNFAGLIEAARELRRRQTPVDELFWELVRDRRFMGLEFRWQHPLGGYVADFYCHAHRLVVDLDGGAQSSRQQKDHKRAAWMQAQGYTVLRFPDEQLLDDPETALARIAATLPVGSGRAVEGVIEGAAFDHLFADRLVDSELGEIPEGWGVGTLGDVAEQIREIENPLESPDVVFRHFSIPAYDEGQWPKHEVGESIKSLKTRVPAGVVLLSKLNPEIERVWLVDVQSGDRAICSTEFLVLAPRPPYGRSHIYCLSRSQSFRQELEGLVTGTSKSHQRAQVNTILGLAVVRPPEPLLRRFEKAAEPLLARTLECRRESRTLAALRDTLLPKLISGELRVGDAEKFVAGVGG